MSINKKLPQHNYGIPNECVVHIFTVYILLFVLTDFYGRDLVSSLVRRFIIVVLPLFHNNIATYLRISAVALFMLTAPLPREDQSSR